MKNLYDIISENVFDAEKNLDASLLIGEFQKAYIIPRKFRYFYKVFLKKYLIPFKSIKDSQYFVIANFSIDYPDYLMSIEFIGPSINGGSDEYDSAIYRLFKTNIKRGSGVVGKKSQLEQKLSEASKTKGTQVFALSNDIGERFWYDALNPWAKKR